MVLRRPGSPIKRLAKFCGVVVAIGSCVGVVWAGYSKIATLDNERQDAVKQSAAAAQYIDQHKGVTQDQEARIKHLEALPQTLDALNAKLTCLDKEMVGINTSLASIQQEQIHQRALLEEFLMKRHAMASDASR